MWTTCSEADGPAAFVARAARPAAPAAGAPAGSPPRLLLGSSSSSSSSSSASPSGSSSSSRSSSGSGSRSARPPVRLGLRLGGGARRSIRRACPARARSSCRSLSSRIARAAARRPVYRRRPAAPWLASARPWRHPAQASRTAGTNQPATPATNVRNPPRIEHELDADRPRRPTPADAHRQRQRRRRRARTGSRRPARSCRPASAPGRASGWG